MVREETKSSSGGVSSATNDCWRGAVVLPESTGTTSAAPLFWAAGH